MERNLMQLNIQRAQEEIDRKKRACQQRKHETGVSFYASGRMDE